MKKNFTVILLIMIFLSMLILPFNYRGWGNIKNTLEDGDGSEFIKNVGLSKHHFSSVEEAYTWCRSHVIFKNDPNPPDVWRPSTSLFFEIILNGLGRGDCEDFSILLCAFLRFHTSGGIPDDRVWVAVGQVRYGAHAWVEYLDKDGVLWILDPLDGIKFNNPISRFEFNDRWVNPLNDIKYGSIFNWGLFKRVFPYEWESKIFSSLIIILLSYLFIEVVVQNRTLYLFYMLFFISLFSILILLVV